MDTMWLRTLLISDICDLMTEVKSGLYVAPMSSFSALLMKKEYLFAYCDISQPLRPVLSGIRLNCCEEEQFRLNLPPFFLKINLILTFLLSSLFRLSLCSLGLTLVASEKGFKEYFDEGFALSALPYPGVQYFKNFVQSSGTGHYPIPPWQKFKLEPHFGRPMRLPSPYRWQDYKKWDQLELTQNIVRYLFSLLRDPKCSGMLVHCISGWDRTPHIVSLLRILLWAEGEAHQSLNVDQMLYLAIAYDWFLFGHQLSHRLKKAHEIMFYTFDVLGHLLSPDFSLYLGEYEPPTNVRDTPQKRPQTPSKASSSSSSTVSSASSSSGAPPSNTTPTAPEAPNTTVSSANATETIIDTTQSTDTTESPANDSTEVQKVDTEIKEISVDSSDATSATPEASQQNSDTNSPTKPSPDDNNSSAGEETAPSPQIVSPEPVPATASTSNPATPRKENPTPPVSEMLNQSIVGLSLEDRIDARKHRLFELRDRFFYFYKTCVYPTYRK